MVKQGEKIKSLYQPCHVKYKSIIIVWQSFEYLKIIKVIPISHILITFLNSDSLIK